ncbi:uncharacterized protein LOC127653810 [Xyrauchen texanus]|uniref:uncharacterized protein LOC127653810 n=1 Tax=Xyrauchen texanus TaxID=154827 RepID=UPI002241E23A|nr:uncharacterized protein LOC127653810 [Xyrauchen texanus]
MILGGKAVKLPLYPSAPDPRHIMSYYLPKAKNELGYNKVVKDVAQSYIYSNIVIREEPGSDEYQTAINDKDLMRWGVLVPTKCHMIRWDTNRAYGAVCDRLGWIDKTDKDKFDLNGSKNGLPAINALSLSWPRYTRFDDPWKETAHVERCLGKEIQQWSDVAIGDEWFDRAKQFRQFLSPIPSVQEIRDLESKTPSEDCAKHRLTHPMGPAWRPVDKSKKANEAELSLCVAELKQKTEYFPRLKAQTAGQKFITAFLEQIKTNDPFAGYEYLNSLWLKSKGTPWYTDSEPPSAIAVALVLAFSVGAIFTDMTETVEEYVEEAWEEFVAASEDLVMGAVKYVLYAFGALLGVGVLCLCVWMCVRFCFSYVCRSVCSNLNPFEEENRLRKLTTRLKEKLQKDNIHALL